MDRLDAMALLVTAVEAGSFSAASRKLGTPLATVSRNVSELEARIGARLLMRTSRRLELTEAGRGYVEAARRILEEVDEAERAAAGEYSAPRGELVVAAPIVFGRLHVLPVATGFLAAYPEIDIRLRLSDAVVDLLEDRVDLALRIGPLPDSSLIARRVGAIRLVACASPDYLDERGEPTTPADLARHDCVVFEQLSAPRSWTFQRPKGQETVAIRPRLVVNTAEAAIDAAVAGLGVTRVLSYQMAAAARAGRLRTILAAYEPEPRPVSLIHSGQGLPPLKLRAFLDYAAPRLRADLAASG